MSAGTDASNIGYGNIAPLSNIAGQYVNIDNSHSPGNFGSNQISGLPGLSGAKNNIDAASGYVPGICLFKGGGNKKFKNKINKISRKYKMKNRSLRSRNRRKLKHKYSRASRKYKNHNLKRSRKYRSRRFRKHRGSKRKLFKGGSSSLSGHIPYPPGYAQYQNNLPGSDIFSVGGKLAPQNLAEANPPPIKPFSTCVDNYNHYTGMGFPSRGY